MQISGILPGEKDVLGAQGIPEGASVPGAVVDALGRALKLLAEQARPVGVVEEIGTDLFEPILEGEGSNEEAIPLERIYRDADFLALYALTLGHAVSRTIQGFFDSNDFALGSLLDTAASLAADRAVEDLERRFAAVLEMEGRMGAGGAVLSYSPGYCGWHISAQQKLFRFLEPHDIDISLNDSCLMTPLKSVSGVLVAGRREIHYFDNSYPFCDACRNKSCQGRMERLRTD
jgi:hypothetical protein